MEQEILKINRGLLEGELRALGFLAAFIEEFGEVIALQTGEAFEMTFHFKLDQVPVAGKVCFETGGHMGMYNISCYELSLSKSRRALIQQARFVCQPWNMFTLVEAMNLMEGRFVYRRQEVDPVGKGYWIYMAVASGVYRLNYMRNGFEVRDFLAETGLGGLLGLEGWVKLVSDLEKGGVCEVIVGSGSGMRPVKVVAEPLERRLRVKDKVGRVANVYPEREVD